MRRRDFLLNVSSILPAVSLADSVSKSFRARAVEIAPATQAWRTFEVTTTVDIADPTGRTQLCMNVID